MKIQQVYTLLNTITQEVLGDTTVVAEDLSNVVEVGKAYSNLTDGLDRYVKALFDHVGRMVFVDRPYAGRMPSLVRDDWEFGAILEKLSMDLPQAEANESWSLNDGTSYDPNIFYQPTIEAKFWNQRVTFEIPISITEKQVKSAFSNATQLNAFYSMIQTAIENALTIRMDELVMRAVNGIIADTLYADYPGAAYSSSSEIKAVNLLYLYNNGPNSGGTPLTAAACITEPEFIRFSTMVMKNYIDRLRVMSDLFNINGKSRFTPADRLHVVLLSEFKNAAGAYLQSDSFHDEYVALPEAETVPFWQGSGTGYAIADTSKIYVANSPGNHAVTCNYIFGAMFDRDACGISCLDRRTTTQYNAKAEFWNEFHKVDCGVWNDNNENCVVFFAA